MNICFICFTIYLWYAAYSATFDYSKCSSSQILNTKNMSCQECPDDTLPNPQSTVPTFCVCKPGFKTEINGTCSNLNLSVNGSQFFEVYTLTGSSGSQSVVNCASTAFPDKYVEFNCRNLTGCTPCPANMSYSQTGSCQCTNINYTFTPYGCFDGSQISALQIQTSSSVYGTQLTYLIFGCYIFHDILSCSHLLNLCVYSLNANEPQCQFFTKANLTQYSQPNTSNAFKLSGSQFSKGSSLSFKLITYLSTGNYVGEQQLQLSDLVRCGLQNDISIGLQVGNNLLISCPFNFNYLVEKLGSVQYRNYVYQLLILGSNADYYEVSVYLPGSSQPLTRFFLEDAYTNPNYINVLTSMTLTLTLNTFSELSQPSLYTNYTNLTLQTGVGVSPASDQVQTFNFQMKFNSSLDTFWTIFIPILITVQVLILLHTIIRTYISYLNRQSLFVFFLNFLNVWSLWTFYLLLVFSGYWFLFTKTTDNVFIFLPQDKNLSLYFYIMVGLMGLFRLVSVFLQKMEKLNTQVFMINWEKGIFRNSWRQIFIVNSLAQLYTHRTISIFWMLIIHLFFMVGLQWDKYTAETVQLNVSIIHDLNPTNPILLYFLSSSILLLIGIIFKILRRISVLCWHYPFENFVDYCNVTNISFFFIRKRSAEAFYIHASIPDRTEVTYKEINDAVRKGLQKNRSIQNQVAFPDSLRLYVVFISLQLEGKFNMMLRREQDQINNMQMRYAKVVSKKLKPIDYREDFIERRLKPQLQNIAKQRYTRSKTLIESMLGIPPLDLRNDAARGRNQIWFDDKVQLTSQIFPNGNQFEQVHTVIIIFLIWAMITNSTPISALLTYLIDQYILNEWIANTCRKKLQTMTKVKEGFMI